jgi:DNA polymerase/3'-5' exonuclease PolX
MANGEEASNMSTGERYDGAWMGEVAERLVAVLAPASARVEVAGSLRRGHPSPRDIEVVAIPRTYRVRAEAQAAMFTLGRELEVNALWEAIDRSPVIAPIKPGCPEIVPDPNWQSKRAAGSRYFRLLVSDPSGRRVKADLFMATPATWGAVLAIRTGSADFARELVTRWTRVSGGHVRGGLLHDDAGLVVPTPEEEDVFRACRLPWVAPRDRDDARAVLAAGIPRGPHRTE